MGLKRLFAKKSLELLDAEAKGENRLRRVLGPISLTSLGVGAIIGAGIFVMTGRTAAVDAGPAVILSYVVAGIGCALAALCYAEFASTVPVAGSAYTYAYATLGEIFAWIIGWDLILEYAMACAVVAAGWTKYLGALLKIFEMKIPEAFASDPFSHPAAWMNLPAVFILLLVTTILVIGIRESATTNAVLVMVKLGVVLFVIVAGLSYINPANWTTIPVTDRLMPEDLEIPKLAEKEVTGGGKLSPDEAKARIATIVNGIKTVENEIQPPANGAPTNRVERLKREFFAFWQETAKLPEEAAKARVEALTKQMLAVYKTETKQTQIGQLRDSGKITSEEAASQLRDIKEKYAKDLPETDQDKAAVSQLLTQVRQEAPKEATKKWGMLGLLGLNRWLVPLDDAVRSPFAPYGLSGIMLGASLVFFAYIGFDSISTHAEEARNPQRDVPFGILASLGICTILYIAVSAVITGMEPYPKIDQDAAVSVAFSNQADLAKQTGQQDSRLLNAAAVLIAVGALAGLTSVLLITFLSQARIFLAMARDGLLPPGIFGAIHPRFRTPHLSTMLTGGLICIVAAFTPIAKLEEMVNIGTLMAFVIVCAAVLILRITRPEAHRPFRCPAVKILAPLGIAVNLLMMLFLPVDTWLRLVAWLVLGLCIYFGYGMRNSVLGKRSAMMEKTGDISPSNIALGGVSQS